jgi:hypothetical protein
MDMESAWNEWMETVVSFSHLLSTVNSSINFVIYCYKDEKFREILLKMILPASCTNHFNTQHHNNTVVLNSATTVQVKMPIKSTHV